MIFRTGYMLLLLSVVLSLASVEKTIAASKNPKDSSKWLKENRLELTVKEDPLAARTHQVFSRVKAAADKTSGRPPKLLILKKSAGQYAAALPDGGIILTKNALKACYSGVSAETGDSRLAFILGHELAHLANNDFKHLDALSEIKGFQGDSLSIKSLLNLYPISSEQIQSTKKMQELDADGFGIVYMALAGYDPRAIVDNDGTNFFRDYLEQVVGGTAYDDTSHPDSEQRAARVRSKLAAVADEVVLYQVGVQYFVHGDLDKAESYFNRFLEKFPSREVFNNIALVHYQRAVEKLSSCDRFLPSRFLLPVFLDSRTIAEPKAGDTPRGTSDCLNGPSFKSEMDAAILWFEKAKERDPLYLPAHLNLTSAFIMSGNGLKAKNAARDTLQIHPESDHAIMLEAISSYLDWIADKNSMAAPMALEKLERLLKDSKAKSPAIQYNIGMVLLENKEPEAAKKHFQAFLEKQASGIHTNRARLVLNMKVAETNRAKRSAFPKPPIVLGAISASTRKVLDKMYRKDDAGEYQTEIYQSPGVIVVVSGDLVELVAVKQKGDITSEAFIKKYGVPERGIQTPLGVVLVYEGFAAEAWDGVVRSLSFYGGN